MSWSIPFLDSKGELFSSLSESNRLPNEPEDSDPDCGRSYNIKESFFKPIPYFSFPTHKTQQMD